MSKELEQLREKRLRWVDANKENNFEDGIKGLLTNLYPDNAHFIYELLQNAEDQHASVATFTLTPTSVEFEHNSTNLFTFANVEAITSIGNSHKGDDPTNIGKFGVGFKAVFAYTSSPEIHSGQYHFRIHDLVVPQVDRISSRPLGEIVTRFLFPFDNSEKPAERACSEIQNGLVALSDNTLLFLSHIRKIEYLLPDSSLGYLQRIDHECGAILIPDDRADDTQEHAKTELGRWTRIEIRSQRGDESSRSSHWLRFHNDVTVEDEKGKPTPCRIAVAYRQEQKKVGQENPKWSIAPSAPGEVSIYFPAAKETSKLRFHLHAPFASTVARDSVRACGPNDALRDHLAQLVANSMIAIRDLGYLDVAFLAVLPNPTDSLSPFYEPIRAALVDAFRNTALVPARSGGHMPGSKLSRSPAPIARTLTDRDITTLSGGEMCLAPNPARDHRENQFLNSLDITEWSWESLNRALSEHSRKAIINQWLSHISDENLRAFYELLKRSLEADRYYDRGQQKHTTHLRVGHLDFVRAQSATTTKMCRVTGSFFQDGPNSSRPDETYFVLPEYAAGDSKAFLEQIGVKPYDEKIIVRQMLERYSEPCAADDRHYDDVRRFVAFAKKFPNETKIFETAAFLLAETTSSQPEFRKPCDLYIAVPYADTLLDALFDEPPDEKAGVASRRVLRLAAAYLQKGIDSDSMFSFAKAIGAVWRLEVNTLTSCELNPDRATLTSSQIKKRSNNNYGRIEVDFFIPQSAPLLAKKDFRCSCLIWKTMTESVEPKHLQACYQHNNVSEHRTAPSLLVHRLKAAEWVPQSDGVFVNPSNAKISKLPKGFSYDSSADWLKAIGFGKFEAEQTLEYRERDEVAKGLGLDSGDQLKELVQVMQGAGLTLEDIRAIAAQRRPHSMPSETVPDPERRRRALLEGKASNRPRQKVLSERTTEPDFAAVTNEAKLYLRARYKTVNDEFPCQCCRHEMPFRLPNGEHFFETIQCVRGLDLDFHQNRLALCPTCAAMYQHAREIDDLEMRHRILEATADDKSSFVEIPVRLARRDFDLYFVGTHWFDLKTLV